MKIRTAVLSAIALFLAIMPAFAQQADPVPPAQIAASIDTRKQAEPVSKYLFGMFIEHISNTMYRSLWAEMVDDRKFYFAIDSKESAAPARPGGDFLRDRAPHKWRPIGGDQFVAMDKENAFVGEQSPRIQLDPSTPHGIRQAGMGVAKSKKYVGRIVIRGTPDARVQVALIWGDGEKDRQMVKLSGLSANYKTLPLSFTAQADSQDAALEITGTGSGTFHIGTISLMPADNVDGFRADTTALLKQLKSGFWRFGGNYTSNYNWYDAIGDRDKRPPNYDYAWNAMQPNDLGMDEFMTLCKLIGTEPYISVNAGFGDSHSAAEQVEYMNGTVQTRKGALRARNGHPEPYHVKLWNIGNEPWGPWQLGRTDLKYFVLKHNEFAKAMRKVDPSITLIASGEMLEDGTVPHEMRTKYVGNVQALYGTESDWTGGFLAKSWGNFDGIAEHWYSQPGRHFDLERAKNLPPEISYDEAYVKVEQTPLESARYAGNVVRRKAEEWEGYQQRFPAMLDKKIFLSIDEYAYFPAGFGRGVNLRLALAYGMIFNEMLRHTDFLTMSAHTTGVSTLDFNRTAATLNTTGLVFQLYGNHFGSLPVEVSGNSPEPAPKYPAGGDQPKTDSGSPTYPLDVVAALTADRKYLTVAVVNATDKVQPLDLNISGMRLTGPATVWQITGPSLEAANHVNQPPQAELKEISLSDAAKTISVAPISINIYRFAVSE